MNGRSILPASAILVLLALPNAASTQEIGTESGRRTPVWSWSDIAVDDLHFIRAVLRRDHPGPADTLNPWFRDWYERGFERALALAGRAEDYPGYFFALKYFTVGFQDGHLGALADDVLDDPRLSFRWPGFVVGTRHDAFVVTASEDPRIPVGATLVSCDGRAADELGRSILQTYAGLWSVRGARADLAPHLFVDAGNPFVAPPDTCEFRTEGGTLEARLEWRHIDGTDMDEKIRAAGGDTSPDFGVRRFADGGGYWITLPSFATGDDSVAAALRRVEDRIRRAGDSIRAARIVVIDVRGNGGGSSVAGSRIVEALWGAGTLEDVRPRGVTVDWRVSEGNVRMLRSNLDRLTRRYGEGSPETAEYRRLVEGVEAALEGDEAFYREREAAESSVPPGLARHHIAGRVFFLTDHACFSACLGFADLLLRIPGIVHVGQETRADAVYIDNTRQRLPSDLGWFGYSMKVYRNRPRGHNESYVPAYRWDGDMRDEEALERWLLGLDEELGDDVPARAGDRVGPEPAPAG